jgi:hypothetical protein
MDTMETKQLCEKEIIRSSDTAAFDQRSPARVAARKSLHMAIATANNYNTPRRGAKLREFEFLIHLLFRFTRFSSIFVMSTASTLFADSRTTTAVTRANVSPTAVLDDKQRKVGSTVDRRKFMKEHRRLDRMVVTCAREHYDNPKTIGLTFLLLCQQ